MLIKTVILYESTTLETNFVNINVNLFPSTP